MRTWTFQQVDNEVRESLDLQDEIFITPDEMIGYVNRAIHEAESIIMTIWEDYFLSQAYLTFTVGQVLFSLPSDIYGQKIRNLLYNNGSVQYSIVRFRGKFIFEQIAMVNTFGLWDDYRYILVNPTGNTQAQIQIAPPSREASTTNVQISYIRSATRVLQAAEQTPPQAPTAPYSTSQLATVLDIPEFSTFLIEYTKYLCLLKDTDPRLPEQKEIMLNQQQLMMASLKNRVPDDDDTIVPDMQYYILSS